MRVRLAVLLAVAAGAASFATPATATCMTSIRKGDLHVYSCSAPGGTPTTYVCYGTVCVP